MEVVRLFDRTALSKGVVLTSEVQGLKDRVVRGDPTRLRQVLLNLVGNAVKFTERGRIVIRASALASENEVLTVRFEVQDTGIGIGEVERAHLFQAFSQADSTTTRRFGGTGLGLAICRRLVEGMGGTIGLTSEPGAGSTLVHGSVGMRRDPSAFRVKRQNDACRGIAPDTAGGRQQSEPVAGGDRAEADGPQRGGGRERRGGRRGRQNFRFDVGILDLQMPVMGGLEAAAEIRAMGAAGDFPLIALTADAMPKSQEDASGDGPVTGFDRWLTKPIDWREMSEAIEQTIRQTEKASPVTAR